MLHDGDTFELGARLFKVAMPYDDYPQEPWSEEDGHGPVTDWTTRAKRPSEMVLIKDNHHRRYYDFAAAVKLARKDGWDTEPYNQGTKGERAARAAYADYNRLRRFCAGDWGYIGVVVALLDDNGDETDETESLWGVESDCGDYMEEVAHELAREILARVPIRDYPGVHLPELTRTAFSLSFVSC